MRTGWAMAAIGAMLAGCSGDGGSGAAGNGAAPAAAATAADPIEAKIDALSDAQRKTVFYKAIYDTDAYQCDEVVKVADRPRDNGHRAWTATCSDTGDYYITLQKDGVLTVSGTPQARSRLPKGTKILPVGTK